MRKETVEFNGHAYHRYPDSPHKHLARYYWPSRTDRKKHGLEVLHREVWRHANGPIPEGCLIHHQDENHLNNDPANLECLTREEHGKRHPVGHPDWLLPHLDRIRKKASEWHRSEEGRRWHKQHGKKVWASVQPVLKVCAFCHREFSTPQPRANVRYCSSLCRQRWEAAHRVHRIEKVCPVCGKQFWTSKYDPARTCGKSCGHKRVTP